MCVLCRRRAYGIWRIYDVSSCDRYLNARRVLINCSQNMIDYSAAKLIRDIYRCVNVDFSYLEEKMARNWDET